MQKSHQPALLALAARRVALMQLAWLVGCAAPNLSRTVGKGNGEIHGSVGGPFIGALGPAVPVPHANVGGRVGATDWLDIDMGTNLLALAFSVLSLDLAAVVQLWREPGGLAVSTSFRLWTLGDLDDPPSFRVFPEHGLHLGGPIPRVPWLHLYGGMTSLVSPEPPVDAPPVLWTPFFGVEFLIPPRPLKRLTAKPRQHGIALHTGWTNPWDTTASVVDYRPKPGAFSFHLGYRVRFGGLGR